MKIVIDIPKEDWEFLKASEGCRWSWTILEGVMNGIPLPKGHGDLIDRSETLRTDRFSDGHEGLRTIQEYAVYAKIRRYLQSLPAIIPAEKE